MARQFGFQVAAILCLCLRSAVAAEQPAKPNILFILCDDLGWRDVGCFGSTYVRKGDWKLIRFHADNNDGSDRLELYNLKDDAGESKNLAAEKPEIVRELDDLITGFLRDTEAVVPIRNPAYNPVGRTGSI